VYVAVFSEITLKGRNRRDFERVLERNVRSVLRCSTTMRGGRLLIHTDDPGAPEKLRKIFGIDLAAPCISVEPEIEAIRSEVARHSFTGLSIRVVTRRSDKSFPLNSQRVNEIVGADLVARGASVDLTNPDRTVYIDILGDRALIAFEKIPCRGGLPVGTAGRVLTLLSGGIDSPVAAWMMMKRGCQVDFLHIHNLSGTEDVMRSKIERMIEILEEYHPPKTRLFLAPYVEFFDNFLSIESRSELVVFRRFILRLGNELARRHRHRALVTGDSLAQVASQTLENLHATDEASDYPVFRPLIGFNKQEIVDLSREIGLYDVSIEPYPDCCSLIAHRNPRTRVKLEDVKSIEERMGIEEVVKRTLEQTDAVEFP
jgi:thiamine biosynthesis protein ThiI